MPKPSLWRLETTCPIQEPWVPPTHWQSWGAWPEQFLQYPLGDDTVGALRPPRHPLCPSPSGDETSSITSDTLLQSLCPKMLVTCGPKGNAGPGNYFHPFPQFLTHTEPDRNDPSSINWKGFLGLACYANMYVTKIPSRGLCEGCLNPVKRQWNNLKRKECKIKYNAKKIISGDCSSQDFL